MLRSVFADTSGGKAELARPAGLEPATYGLGNRRSILAELRARDYKPFIYILLQECLPSYSFPFRPPVLRIVLSILQPAEGTAFIASRCCCVKGPV